MLAKKDNANIANVRSQMMMQTKVIHFGLILRLVAQHESINYTKRSRAKQPNSV